MELIEPSQRWSGSNRVHLEAHALGPTLPVAGGGRIRRPQLPQPSPILPEPVRWVRLSLQTPAGGAEEEFRLSRGRWEGKVGKQSKNEGGLRDGGGRGRGAVQTDIKGWSLVCTEQGSALWVKGKFLQERMFHMQQSKKGQPLVRRSPASGGAHQQPVKWSGSNSSQSEIHQRISESKVWNSQT